MARTSMYNHNYPGKRIEKGVMLAMDGMKLVNKYIREVVFSKAPESSKLEAIHMLNMCLNDFIGTNPWRNIHSVKQTVRIFMGINEYGNEETLKIVCTFMEEVLHTADNYSGFNNYKWSNGGSTAWHNDHPNKYDSDELYKIASDAMRDEKYNSQEYHRIYY